MRWAAGSRFRNTVACGSRSRTVSPALPESDTCPDKTIRIAGSVDSRENEGFILQAGQRKLFDELFQSGSRDPSDNRQKGDNLSNL